MVTHLKLRIYSSSLCCYMSLVTLIDQTDIKTLVVTLVLPEFLTYCLLFSHNTALLLPPLQSLINRYTTLYKPIFGTAKNSFHSNS